MLFVVCGLFCVSCVVFLLFVDVMLLFLSCSCVYVVVYGVVCVFIGCCFVCFQMLLYVQVNVGRFMFVWRVLVVVVCLCA